jgi:hypothetical protein
MGAIDNFLKRRGYAKLDRFGLVLTPDDRVLSTRPAVLDDGLGNKIVGWVDGDLAAMELDRYAPAAVPAAAKRVAATRSGQMPALPKAPPALPKAPPAVRPLPGMTPIASAPAPVAPAPMAAAPVFAPAPAPVVAAEPELTEDEWEWEIAMARVRAAAADVADSASAMQFTKPKAPAAPRPSAPKLAPMASVAMGRPEPMPAWPKTEPLAAAWDDRTEASAPPRVMLPIEKEIAVARRSTVIPVPQLPVAARPSDVRPPPSTRTISPRTRMARGTSREDTVQTQPIAPANEDTSPYVTLPPEVRGSTAYAHTKRAAAKHR